MDQHHDKLEISPTDLARLGGGAVAYIRPIGAEDAIKLMGNDAHIPADATLYCLYQADGTPISISGTPEAALGSAHEHELITLSVH